MWRAFRAVVDYQLAFLVQAPLRQYGVGYSTWLKRGAWCSSWEDSSTRLFHCITNTLIIAKIQSMKYATVGLATNGTFRTRSTFYDGLDVTQLSHLKLGRAFWIGKGPGMR
jgi:hypothetical protein